MIASRHLRAAPRRLRALLPFRDPATNRVVIVFGTGRSGTTWLAEQLADATRGRLIFEPLHPAANVGRNWMGNRTYLRADDPAPQWRALISPILSGTLRNRWTDRYNSRFHYAARIVKMIRGNLMLGWIAHSHPEAHIALVIRDPVEVAHSQLRSAWPVDLDRFTSQPALVEDYPILRSALVTDAHDQFELNVLHWAIENRVALDQLVAARAHGAHAEAFAYHELRDQPERFRAFLTFCGAPASDSSLQNRHRPSRVSRAARPDSATEAERVFATQVAEAFGLTDYLAFRPGDERQAR